MTNHLPTSWNFEHVKTFISFSLLIQFEPIIQSGHEGVVHHILLYECSDNFPKHHMNYTGRCYGPDMPPPVEDCTGVTTIAAWAIGGKVSTGSREGALLRALASHQCVASHGMENPGQNLYMGCSSNLETVEDAFTIW